MSNKKQTAVDWLVDQLENNPIVIKDWVDVLKRTKAMEKEQIVKAYREGRTDEQSGIDKYFNRSSEQYYNQTYGGHQ